jgi:2-oxoglutarate ferredoxin oxidoreductase subunit alpha
MLCDMSHELSLSIVGAGGDGAVAAGDILSMASAREGLSVIKTEAYGPQIRGGESSCTVRISATPIHALADALDALVVFHWSDFARFKAEMTLAPSAIIFYDANDAPPEDMKGYRLYAIDFTSKRGAKNIFSLGLLSAVFGLPAEAVRGAIRGRFAKKAEAIVTANIEAFDGGFAQGLELAIDAKKLDYVATTPKLLMSGNDATSIGAVEAGCRFFAGYPITPSSEILHSMSEWLPRMGGSCLQTEDELAAIGAVVGGAFAGAKAMTSTSGPGLSLMSEMLGLAAIAEVPAVVINVQRGGPSTGIPTKSEQSDLWHALYAGHGDMPRVVLGCMDVEDSFHTTVDAFNIAEEFQTPVIVLSEQSIAQARQTLDADTLVHEVIERRIATPEELENYRRYRVTDDGVSPMSIPGMKLGEYQTNGLEHDEQGRPSSMYTTHETMNAKRWRKLDSIAKKYGHLFTRFGPDSPDLGILCWGSSAGVVREAVDRLTARGYRVAAFAPRILMPLPAAEMQAFIDAAKTLLVLEISFARQFYRYLKSELALPSETLVFARSGGKNLTVSEVMTEALRALAVPVEHDEVLA